MKQLQLPARNHRGFARRGLAAGAALTLALAASGCNRDINDLEAYMAEVKARPSAALEPIPEMKEFHSVAYTAHTLRDPFTVPLAEPVERRPRTDGPRPDMARPREALEEHPLDTLRMMGTIEQQGMLWALIRDRVGKIHRVQTGHYIGQNYGEIVAISERTIKLRELVPDGRGGFEHREAALAAAN